MNFFNSRRAGALVLTAAVIFGVFFGSHRSLNGERKKVAGQNENVMMDLETRVGTAHNLCTVAGRYLPPDDEYLTALSGDLAYADEHPEDETAFADLVPAARAVIMKLKDAALSEQDARYLSNFETQIESGVDTISRDPYTAAARRFNEETLGGFPARILGALTGVKELPVYQ